MSIINSYDVLKELSQNYSIEDTKSIESGLTIKEATEAAQEVLESVEVLGEAVKYPAEAVSVFEHVQTDGSKLYVVDSYELGHYMESCAETDPVTALGNVASANLVPDDGKFAVLIDRTKLEGIITSVKESDTGEKCSGLGCVGIATEMLKGMINKGIVVVSNKK